MPRHSDKACAQTSRFLMTMRQRDATHALPEPMFLSPGEQLPVSLVLVRHLRRKPETCREHAHVYSAIWIVLYILYPLWR